MLEAVRDAPSMAKIDEREFAQVERILRSETLRTSGTLRHLLSFLAFKTRSGEADALKEYTVAIDALQRPTTYDPKHDSTVRLQVSRLRQKLAEYYRDEGKDDPIMVDLPRGRYKLMFVERRTVQQDPAPVTETRKLQMLIWGVPLICFILLIAFGWKSYPAIGSRQGETIDSTTLTARSSNSEWTSEIQALWGSFVTNGHPLILAIEDPLFMQLQRGAGEYYREKSVNNWQTLTETHAAIGLRRSLSNPRVLPDHHFATIGEVDAAFIIGRLLGNRQPHISLVRLSDLSWLQLADSNAIFVGEQPIFDAQLQGEPIRPQLINIPEGVENLHANPGEPELYTDQFTIHNKEVTSPNNEGGVYALVTRLPGPGAGNDVMSFISKRTAGYLGALQWFTDPQSTRILATKLGTPGSGLPKYFQVVLEIRFQGDVPTEVSYVLGRELR